MIDLIATFIARYFFVIPVVLGGIFFLKHPWEIRKKMIVLSATSLPLTVIGIFILNSLYYDPRPFITTPFDPIVSHIPDNGFPSDHAALTFLIAIIMYQFNRKIGLFLFFISIVVSITRVYLGLHHFIDILAGTLLAIVTVAISQAVIKSYISKSTQK